MIVWEDEKILEAGENPSLFYTLRKSVAGFLEYKPIARLILGKYLSKLIIFSDGHYLVRSHFHRTIFIR